MIYTFEIEYSDGKLLQIASDMLQPCIDFANNHPHFPMLGKRLIFTTWKDNQKYAVSTISGHRSNAISSNVKTTITYDEVMEKFRAVS